MQAIILAAGMGTRLRPLTLKTPKPLIPVQGEPMAERQIKFLHEKGITDIIAGGMGSRARELFIQNGITVFVGAPCEESEKLAQEYLKGTLKAGENACDH